MPTYFTPCIFSVLYTCRTSLCPIVLTTLGFILCPADYAYMSLNN